MVSSSVAHRNSVDLPEPDGPMIDTTCPSSTERLMSVSTSAVPNCLRQWLISRIRIAVPSPQR